MTKGFDFMADYFPIADYVSVVLKMKDKWEDILDAANSKLPSDVIRKAKTLPATLFDNRRFYERANISRGEDLPEGTLTVAIASYLLMNRNKITA